jgi:hypothetical protein
VALAGLEVLGQSEVDMRLADTVNLMYSNDWKDRFIAEYIQLQIRIIKLEEALNNTSDSFTALDSMTKAIMFKQLDAMKSYRSCLEKRADIANIDLYTYPLNDHE